MIIWAGVCGALIGWCLIYFDGFGFWLGGAVGLIAGWALRRSVRAEIARETSALREHIDLLLAEASARPAPAAASVVETPAADRMPALVVDRPLPERAAAAVSAVPAPPPEPVAPPEPTILETAVAAARGWLFGGNTIVRVGLVILFVGLSFLASYAASAGLFPIELRLALVVAFGVGLLAIGFRTRDSRPDFGLVLQGAGIATIYLALFAGARLYDTVPVVAAFAMMIVVCALGCALALLQRSQALAVTAFSGGFAVPLLLSSGGGDVRGLFAYYTILNLAILFIAQRRTWRALNLVGFLATFGVAALWVAGSYRPEDFVTTQAFLILSVLIYVATAILYTRATPGRFGQVVDTTLVFGPALAGFALEVALVHDRPFGSAFAALAFAALYLGVAAAAMRTGRDSLRVMNETMLAIGIGFVTLAVPLALGARWTSAAWALEGAGAFWVGKRQARWMPRLFGIALQLMAALVLVATLSDGVFPIPLANPDFLGAMLVALAALATAWWLRAPLPHGGSRIARGYARGEAMLATPAFLFGFVFWCLAWISEVMRLTPAAYAGTSPAPVFAKWAQPLLVMLAFVASAGLAQMIGRRTQWSVAGWPSHATLPALALAFFAAIGMGRHVLSVPDVAIWIVAIGLHLRLLYVNDRDAGADRSLRLRRAIHVGGVWLATAILADSLWLGIDAARLWDTAWAEVTFLLATVAVLAVLSLWAGPAMAGGRERHWPLDRFAASYGWHSAIPVALLAYAGALLTAMFSSGEARPLPFVPVLNPVDLSLGLALAVLELWRRTILAADPRPAGAAALRDRRAFGALAVLAFVIVNTMWLRGAHHLLGVAWAGDALLGSVVVQTGLAILWTVLALALMVTAHRRGLRTLWLIGAGLLGLTVVKLLLVDLNAAGGGARIIAFIVVGLLMLVVGYLAPLPPRSEPADVAKGVA